MKYNKITKLMNRFLKGDTSTTIDNLREIIDMSCNEGDITYFEARELSKKISEIDINNLTVFDNYRSGIEDLLFYYYEDYSETNYAEYDLDKKLERDLILEIIEKIDTNHKFNSKENLCYISFLQELKNEYSSAKISNSLVYMIEYIEAYTFD